MFPQTSRSLLHGIVNEVFCYNKTSARWVPTSLTFAHKKNRMGAALEFLTRYDADGDIFLDLIVTGDETWISYKTPGNLRATSGYGEASHEFSSDPRKETPNLNTRNVMVTVFWDRNGLIHMEFLPRGETINSEAYCDTLQRLQRAIQNKRGFMSENVFLIHDNARHHSSARTQRELQRLNWEVFGHPPFSPDLAPSDFHLFPKLKEFVDGRSFVNGKDLKQAVACWLKSLAIEEYKISIEQLVPRYNKCLDSYGDYIEK